MTMLQMQEKPARNKRRTELSLVYSFGTAVGAWPLLGQVEDMPDAVVDSVRLSNKFSSQSWGISPDSRYVDEALGELLNKSGSLVRVVLDAEQEPDTQSRGRLTEEDVFLSCREPTVLRLEGKITSISRLQGSLSLSPDELSVLEAEIDSDECG